MKTPEFIKGRLRRVKRMVVKVGTHLLRGDGEGLNLQVMDALARQIATIREQGIEVILVSSGAVGAGAQAMGVKQPPEDISARQALAAVGQALNRMGEPGQQRLRQYQGAFGAAARIIGAQEQARQAEVSGAYGALGGRGFGQEMWERGVGAAKRLTSGFEMMWINRMWGMTGGRAMQAQAQASQQETAVTQAMASFSGGSALGSMTQGLLGIDAARANAQASMGRGSYMAYGGVQRMLAGSTGELAGVALPAVGAGVAAGRLLQSPEAGLAVGAGALALGVSQYWQTIGSNQAELEYKAGGNLWDQLMAAGGKLRTGNMKPEPYASMRGQFMREGSIGFFEGDPASQAVTMRHWAEQQSRELGVMDAGAWAQQAGQFRAYSDRVTAGNITVSPTADDGRSAE